MPGFKVARSCSKSLDAYKCVHCGLLIKDAVRITACDHIVCESCIEELISSTLNPKCPWPDCGQDLVSDRGAHGSHLYLPDWATRREVKNFTICCTHHQKGCKWEGEVEELEKHLGETCNYGTERYQGDNSDQSLRETFECIVVHHDHYQNEASDLQDIPTCSRSCNKSTPAELVVGFGYWTGSGASNTCCVKFEVNDSDIDTDLCPIYERTRLFELLKARTKEKMERKKRIQENQEKIALLRGQITCVLNNIPEIEKINGKILWKVSNFCQKMEDARKARQTVIQSPPFFLERHKACLLLYPNGRESAEDSHMSVYFTILKGEFDEDLQFPFAPTIIFRLTDQTGDRDISKTIQADSEKCVSQRPESDDNCVIGCPHFVSHAELWSGGFVEDDTLFVECQVSQQ